MTEQLQMLNRTGFPLQIALANSIRNAGNNFRWQILYAEHAWVNSVGDQSGFIDLVLQNREKNTHLIVECKRVADAQWMFIHPDGTAKHRSHAKSWVASFDGGRCPYFGWHDIQVEPYSPEALFCVTEKGRNPEMAQKRSVKGVTLEQIGAELIAATEALAMEERDFRPREGRTLRLYLNVIVTTADLIFAEFDPNDLSPDNGTLKAATFQSVPLVRLRKQMSRRCRPLSQKDYEDANDPVTPKENTIFVVGSRDFIEFLNNLEVSETDITSYR